VARDRKRAKQRRERSAGGSGPARPAKGALSPSQPVRTEVPGSLDHASGEADEFEAAIVRGADGVPVPEAELDDSAEDLLQESPEPAGREPRPPGSGSGNGGPAGPTGVVGAGTAGTPPARERPSGAPIHEGNRAIGFIRASWAELQRVQWPDRRHVTQATTVVLGFVVVAGAYLGLADYVAKELVEYIL
jgi:preprotein translocase SecE subunit